MINTALSSRCGGPHSRFLCRSTMEHVHGILLEHVYGILLDEKFLHRSTHAAFVNTKWYEAWLERTLFLDPIIFDMWIPGVLSWASGQPCNSHHERHTISLACLSSALTRKTHKFGGLSLVHYESTSTRSWCSSAARLRGSFVTVQTQASCPSGHRARVIF